MSRCKAGHVDSNYFDKKYQDFKLMTYTSQKMPIYSFTPMIWKSLFSLATCYTFSEENATSFYYLIHTLPHFFPETFRNQLERSIKYVGDIKPFLNNSQNLKTWLCRLFFDFESKFSIVTYSIDKLNEEFQINKMNKTLWGNSTWFLLHFVSSIYSVNEKDKNDPKRQYYIYHIIAISNLITLRS